MLLYADDMIITGDDQSDISELQDHLHNHFKMKSMRPLRYFFSLEISDTSDGYYLSQTKYASDLLSTAGLTDSKTAPTLLESDCRLTLMDGAYLDDPTLYHQLVGSLIYLTITRPDISYAIHIVSQFMSAPRMTHYSVVYGFFGTSKKQMVVSRSGAESKYRALADTTAELLWLRWLLVDLAPTTFPTTSQPGLSLNNFHWAARTSTGSHAQWPGQVTKRARRSGLAIIGYWAVDDSGPKIIVLGPPPC
ncbi:uncharacterized mitochondrial protein AtMg00810-like [Andrographis paniculata]|uniref:uncharacterized mitochondrial protein AtMg00810-like n=1 Tax=Andrographis paniculata TaxID=175694 RepID=UPI0021E6E091|nr:uncharacterized mitochondrial protein AtMg00810-like [Andrographis paniculata]